MRIRWLYAMCAAAALGITVAARGQSIDDFDGWMRTIDEKNQNVQQSIARKEAKGAAADAKGLQATFRLVEEFWVRRGNGADAVDLAKEARERAADIEKAVGEDDFGRAATAAIKVAETCTPCHRVHRPLADNGFTTVNVSKSGPCNGFVRHGVAAG